MARKKAEKKSSGKKSPTKDTSKTDPKKPLKIKIEWIFLGVLGILLIASIFTQGFSSLPFNLTSPISSVLGGSTVDKDVIKEQTTAYLNEVVLGGQATAEILEVTEDADSGLYSIKIKIGEQEFESFVSKDGKYLYVDRMEITQAQNDENGADETADAAATAEIPKSDKPEVLVFTMSYCPYGNQAEDMIEPVQALFGDNASIEPHYVIYSDYASRGGAAWNEYCLDEEEKYCSMHGIQELNQNVRELCTYKYQEDKYWDFVMAANESCDSSNVDKCWEDVAAKVGVDVNKIRTCQQDEAEALLAQEVELNEKYEVTGSPTVLINETKYSGTRTPEAFKTALCSSYNSEPELCAQQLDDSAAATTGSCN